MKHLPPSIDKRSFTCPHCGAISRHYHYRSTPQLSAMEENAEGYLSQRPVHVTLCEHCQGVCIWWKNDLVYPNRGSSPQPNQDMPEDVKKDYEEAARIYTQSPRGAAALLRLAIQKVVNIIGDSKKNINDNIADFVKNGLPPQTQKALDAVRVIGNNAVHPGQIETDNKEIAMKLFFLVNVIVQSMITTPKEVDEIYEGLPESAKKAINNRDKN